MKFSEILDKIEVGSVLEFADGEIMLIGHADLSRQPTNNDGGLGWDEEYLYREIVKFRKIDYQEVLNRNWYD